jgi:EpsI family protein
MQGKSALMKFMNTRYFLIGIVLILAAWGGVALTPTKHIADQGLKVDLETMIPKQFADWRVDETIMPLQVDPQRLALINKIYRQTLSRTYFNHKGERVMLSIAYGGDQSDSMQVHKPEVCYPAQGFQMDGLVVGTLNTGYSVIPVKRMLATMGSRVEPITYWITIGDTVAMNSVKWKLAQMKYGLTGKVPDGMIFRVSSLGEQSGAYPLQENFIRTLLKFVSSESRSRLIGSTTL